MTTIAYRDGVLAADTRATSGDVIVGSSALKIAKRGRVMAAASGTSAYARRFMDWFRSGMKGDPPPSIDPNDHDTFCWGLLVTGDDRRVLLQQPGWIVERGPYFAMGSGRDFALGAMAHGASAEEAVRAAIAHDVYSGGDITVLRVEADTRPLLKPVS